MACREIPCATEQGNFFKEQGISWKEQGIVAQEQGTRPRTNFLDPTGSVWQADDAREAPTALRPEDRACGSVRDPIPRDCDNDSDRKAADCKGT
jgi:hypothetical protein